MSEDKTGGLFWKDATNYPRGKRGRIEPRAWAIEIRGVRVWIGNNHVFNPGNWSLTCSEIKVEVKTICPADAHHESAKDAALSFVSAALRQKSENLRFASDAMIAARKGADT